MNALTVLNLGVGARPLRPGPPVHSPLARDLAPRQAELEVLADLYECRVTTLIAWNKKRDPLVEGNLTFTCHRRARRHERMPFSRFRPAR